MGVHRIRLREPWQCEIGSGGVCWQRRFNQPTGLGQRERIWLVVERLAGSGEVRLNNELLGRVEDEPATAIRFDITARLRPQNEIILLLSGPPEPPAVLTAEIRLEIFDQG